MTIDPLPRSVRQRFTGLWRHPDFIRLWIGQTISVFGSLVGASAMAFTAISVLNASPFQLALLSTARVAPGFLIGLVAGVCVDRMRRRPILIASDIGRFLGLATIPIGAVFGFLCIGQLYLVTLVVSVLTVFFDVAYQSYLPSLIGRAELIEGNSKLSASSSVAEVGGLGLSGWLVQIFTAPITILVDAISFIGSAISIGLIRAKEPPPAGGGRPGMHREIAAGLRVVLHQPVLRVLAACTLTQEFCGGLYGVLVMLYMLRDLGLAPATLGTIWAVGGISSLIGAAGTGRATQRFGIGPTMIGGLLLSSIAMFLIPLAQGRTVVAITLLVLQQIFGDGPATIYQINHVSLRQTITPESLLGRVNASTEFLRLGATLAGSLLGGALGELIGVRTTLFCGAFGVLLSTLWLILSPVRSLRVPSTYVSQPEH